MHSRPYFVDWALEHLLYCILLYSQFALCSVQSQQFQTL